MEIDKALQLGAAPAQVWTLLLDPQAMGECVPGMQSVDVISADEYAAQMHVKISFISARFKLRTRIVERREPHYLKAEGTGEDSAAASSLKQTTEMFLEPRGDGGTDLRLKVKVDLLGRMGSFGLSVMKTKADRMWDEFGTNLAARLAAPQVAGPAIEVAPADAALAAPAAQAEAVAVALPPVAAPAGVESAAQGLSWWRRLFRPAPEPIRIVVVRGDTRIETQWPAQCSEACLAWLREVSRAS